MGESVKANHLTERVEPIELCMQLMSELGNEKSTFVGLGSILEKMVAA